MSENPDFTFIALKHNCPHLGIYSLPELDFSTKYYNLIVNIIGKCLTFKVWAYILISLSIL